MKIVFALEMTPPRNSVVGRREQIFDRLSRDYKIYYVSKMENILSIIKNHPKDILKYLKLEIIYKNDNYIQIMLPATFLPGANIFRTINKINNLILGYFIWVIKNKFKIQEVNIWWVGYPFAVDYLKDKHNIIYDCFDEHLGWKGFFRKRTVRKIEQDLLKRADYSIFSASKLLENKGKTANKSRLILNGADYGHFYISPEKSIVREKIVLYSGVISNWFDIELVEHCIKHLPEFIFWFVGPDRGNHLRNLVMFETVKYYGFIEYKFLPEYYHKASVCIIPFKIEKLIENTNPIKMYEYLAAGKPVIATQLPEAEKYNTDVYIAKNKYEFSDSINKSYLENNISKIIHRQKTAHDNSWENRVNEVKIILSSLQNKSTVL